MEPSHAALFLPFFVALATPSAQESARSIDLERLAFPYAELDLHPGLDRTGLDDAQNAPEHNRVTDRGAQLGRVLFYDKRLSRNGTTACASCHLQEAAFADPKPLSRGFEGKRTLRNSMSLANLAYYEAGRFFWDERGTTLEEMVLEPIQDKIEMGMSLTELVERLNAEGGYRWLFLQAYGDPEITPRRIAYALAQFLRSMVSFDSKFDEGLALTGSLEEDFPNFTQEENLGKSLFLGTHDGGGGDSCASCHVRDTGTAAPKRPETTDGSVFRRPRPVLFQGTGPSNNGLDAGRAKDDRGFGAVTDDRRDDGKFKAPSLRNIELTGPYMHDGRFKNLRQVIEHYSTGLRSHPNLDARLRPSGGWGSGGRRPKPIAHQEPVAPVGGISGSGLPPFRRPGEVVVLPGMPLATPAGGIDPAGGRTPSGRSGFRFTNREKKALIAFLRTLTDHDFVKNPKFADPFR